VNDKLYQYGGGPLAKGYQKITPSSGAHCRHQLFSLNLRMSASTINNLLPGNGQERHGKLYRLAVNTFFVIGGLIDSPLQRVPSLRRISA